MADLFGLQNLCLFFMIKCLQLQLRLQLASHWIIRKKKGTAPGILGGLVKGFKGRKVNNPMDLAANSKSNFSQLETIFLRNPFSDPVATTTDDQERVFELNIGKATEREQLFDVEVVDAKTRLRMREEIIATYKKAGDASSVAGQARDELVERQERLERISRQIEELRSRAEDFASLTNELVEAMEGQKVVAYMNSSVV